MDVQKYRPVFLAAGFVFAVAIGFGAYDFFVLDVLPHKEGPPEASPYRLLRAACAALSAVLVVAAISATRSAEGPLPVTEISTGERWAVCGIAVLSLVTIALFYVDADLFSQVSSEDGIVESVSAFALLAATLCLSASMVLSLRDGDAIKAIAFCGLALGCFVVGMEEISWGQRLVGFDSPDVFVKYNLQKELNLHNLASDLSENIYYLGAFGFLILLPFLHDVSPIVSEDHPLSVVIPERKVIFASALVAAYNWDMWRVIPIQMAFYITVLILIYYLVGSAKAAPGDRAMIVLTTFALVVNQVAFLIWGDRQSWTWATTEYKELFIPLGLLFYSVVVLAKRQPQAGLRDSAPQGPLSGDGMSSGD